ncbi:hypothetical protein G9A89_009491 [Geosiphon pyriformis]|nr:hypothetical protein G9A89_009491 [Geosiphon pyriformis]
MTMIDVKKTSGVQWEIYARETDQLTDEAQKKSVDNCNDNLNQMWLTIKKTVLQAADCLPKRKVEAQSTHTKKECMDHKLVKIIADIIKQIRINNTDMYDINIMQFTRKILTKILTARISKACELHNVLKSYNTSVLKNTSTAVPIYVINAVAEHAREFGNEAWFTFQDMKKGYDSVGWKPMEAALKRIKINNRFTKLFGLMHNNRSNRIITKFGLSDEYHVQDGLDQGETSSPIM